MEAKAFSDPKGVFYDRVLKLTRSGPYKETAFQAVKRYAMLFVTSSLPEKIQKYLPKAPAAMDEDAIGFFIEIFKHQLNQRVKSQDQAGFIFVNTVWVDASVTSNFDVWRQNMK